MLIKEIENEVPKYLEAFSESLGRYLVAGKKLSPGEVILREKPIAVGPAVFNDNDLCSGCLRVIPKIPLVDWKIVCKNCGIAVFCSASCEQRKNYHTIEECEVFKSNESLKELNQSELRAIIFPLRLWLLKKSNSDLWEKIVRLEAHLEERKGTAVWKDRQESVVDVLKKLKLINEEDEAMIQRICGIVDVNSFELRSPGTLDTSPLRGLYPEAALMSHDCRGNTHLTVDDDFNLTVYASLPIEHNQPILFNYTSSLLGTLERRAFLREGKYFDCQCEMCKSPEELGAHLSSINCPRCRKGFLRVDDNNLKNPFVRQKIWNCGACGHKYSGRLVRTTIDLAQWKIIQADQTNAKDLENLIKYLTATFHPNHSLILNLKQKLLALYREELSALHPRRNVLHRILELCKEFVQVLEIIEPGISRLKGIMLYEMHLPLVILSNRQYTGREITSEELAKYLEEASNSLKKSLSMLLLEPPTTPEGLLAKKALQQYKTLRQNLEDVKFFIQNSKNNDNVTKKMINKRS